LELHELNEELTNFKEELASLKTMQGDLNLKNVKKCWFTRGLGDVVALNEVWKKLFWKRLSVAGITHIMLDIWMGMIDLGWSKQVTDFPVAPRLTWHSRTIRGGTRWRTWYYDEAHTFVGELGEGVQGDSLNKEDETRGVGLIFGWDQSIRRTLQWKHSYKDHHSQDAPLCWESNPGPSEAGTRACEKDCRSYDLQPVKGKEWILCSRGTRGDEESPKKQIPSSSHFFKII
jgi:hypothetical protein